MKELAKKDEHRANKLRQLEQELVTREVKLQEMEPKHHVEMEQPSVAMQGVQAQAGGGLVGAVINGKRVSYSKKPSRL